jgi:hypothetical protein
MTLIKPASSQSSQLLQLGKLQATRAQAGQLQLAPPF